MSSIADFFYRGPRFLRRAPYVPDEASVQMKRNLTFIDLTMFGIAAIIGAGIFVLTGRAASTTAGPAIVISYFVSGLVSLISALAYAEYACETTVTGGIVEYSYRTFGSFGAWFVAVNVLCEYIFAAAAVAKGFASYFATMVTLPSDYFIVYVNGQELDPLAFGIVLLMAALLIIGTKESSWFNIVTTGIALIVVFMCIIIGFIHVDADNWVPFNPYGFRGMFNAASTVFFAYIGFDQLATAAEEAKNPQRDVPAAILVSVIFCSVLYCLMALAITGMVPYSLIDTAAPFSSAFVSVGVNWMSYVVSIGACMAILDTIIVIMYGMARTFVVLARVGLMPSIVARVNARTGTPIAATSLVCMISAVLALLLPLQRLADLVSAGTLAAFSIMHLGILHRRFYHDAELAVAGPWRHFPVFALQVSGAFSLGFVYQLNEPWWTWVLCGGVWFLGMVACFFYPTVWKPTPGNYGMPLFPVLPSIGVLSTLFLIGTLGQDTWIQWAYAMAAMAGIWIIYAILDVTCGASLVKHNISEQEIQQIADAEFKDAAAKDFAKVVV